MKVVYEYSHLGGAEILQVRYPQQNAEIYEVIAAVRPRLAKVSREKTMAGRLLYDFNENKADVGVEIVPCHALKRRMSTGVSYGEQLVYDIERLKRHFPAVPVKVILIDVEE